MASETGRSSPHPAGKFSPTMLRKYPWDDSKSTDTALVVLTDLRHDPLYGKTIARQQDIGLESRDGTTLGETLRSSADLPSTQWSSCQETAVPTSRKQENIRTLQQSGIEAYHLTRTVHPAKRSRRVLEEAGINSGVLQAAIPSLLNADAIEDRTGATGNPSSMDSLAGPVLRVEPSNIYSSRDKLGTTVVSTSGAMQQSPILGQRVGRQTKVVEGAGELCGPSRPTRATPLPDSDSDASGVEGGVAQPSVTPVAPPRNFQKRDGGSSLLPSPRRWGIPVECTSSSGNFGLLEALEMGRRNMNKALDEISDAGTRRALRSVMDEKLCRLSVAISS